MTESDGNRTEDEIVVDLGYAVPDDETTVITDQRVAEAVRTARDEYAAELAENVNAPLRDINIRVHSW